MAIGTSLAGFNYNAATKTWTLNTASVNGFTALANTTFDVGVQVVAGGITRNDISHNELQVNTVPPTLALDSVTGDNYINAKEKLQALVLTGTTNAEVGSVVHVTFNNVNYTATVRVGTQNGVNVFSIPVSAAAIGALNDGVKAISLNVTNVFGSTTTISSSVIVDTGLPAPAPVITIIESLNGINAAELADGLLTNVILPTNSVATDEIVFTVTDSMGVVRTFPHTVTAGEASNRSASVTLPSSVFAANGSYTVTAFTRDLSQNMSPVSTALIFNLDTQAPGKNSDGTNAAIVAPMIAIEEAGSGVSHTELADGIQMQVIFPSGSVEGDVLTFTVTDPSLTARTFTYTLTPQEAGDGRATISIPVNRVEEDGLYTVSAFSTDLAGNSSAAGTFVFTLTAGITAIIEAAANNSATATNPSLAIYQNVGITDVTTNNLVAINSALNSPAVTGDKVDTVVEIQALVNSYNKILTEANGASVDADTNSNPAASDYATIGATIGLAATQANNLALLNSFVGSKNANDSAVTSIAGINALATIANAIIAEANGLALDATPNVNLSQADYSAIGITVSGAALTLLNDMLGVQHAGDVTSLDKIENLARIAQAIETVAAGGTPNPLLTDADLTLAGVQGVTAGNLAGILAVIASKPDNGSGSSALSNLQGLTSAQVAALTTTQVAALTTADISEFTTDGVSGFSSAQIAVCLLIRSVH